MAVRTISNAGGAWATAATWVEGVVPTSVDDVVATATSGALTINAAGACRSLDLTGMTKTITGSSVLTVGSSTAGPGDVLVQVPASGFSWQYSGTLTLNTSAPTPQTVSLLQAMGSGGCTITGTGTVKLLGNLSALPSGAITLSSGTFDSNGFAVSAASIDVSGSTARSLLLGTSTVTVSAAQGFKVAGSNYTISAASATFAMSATAFFEGGGATYGTVKWANVASATPPYIAGNNTIGTLSIRTASTAQAEFHISGTQTVTTLFEAIGSATFRLMVGSASTAWTQEFTAGVTGTINLGAAGTATIAHASFMDIAVTGTNTPVTGTRIGDAGGNSGITADASRVLYWVGNAGTWSDTGHTHWTLTSGGAPAAGILHPLPQDDVVVDASSLTAANQSISVDQTWMCRNFSVNTSQTGCKVTSTPTSISFFGSVALLGSGGFIIQNPIVYLRGRGAFTLTPNTSGQIANTAVNVHAPSGSVALTADLVIAPGGTLRLWGGVFDAAGFKVTLQAFNGLPPATVGGSTVRELRMGDGLWTLANGTAWGTAAAPFTLTFGAATLLVSGAPGTVTFTGPAVLPPTTVSITAGKMNSSGVGVTFTSLTHMAGNIDCTGGFTTGSFTSTGTTPRTISGSGSSLTVNGPITLSGGSSLTYTYTGPITCSPSPGVLDTSIYTNGVTFGNFTLKPPAGGQISIFDPSPVTATLTITPPAGPATVIFNDTATSASFVAAGNSVTNRLKIYGPSAGGTATLSTSSATNINSVDFVNINKAGTATWTGTSQTTTFTGYRNYATDA